MASELTHLFKVARRSTKERGLVETLRGGPAYLRTYLRRLRAWRRLEQEDGFDRQYGTDTTTILHSSDFGATSENLRYAEYFRSTPPRLFARIMAAINIRHEDFIFIDFGSGKGRTLLLASEFPFKRIIGVEFSPKLHVIAQKNTQIYQSKTQKSKTFELECVDAVSYTLPIENTVFYFFDPFKLPVMSAVLENIRKSIEKHPRRVFIVYVNPNQWVAMSRSGFLETVYESRGGAPETSAEAQLSIPWIIYTNSVS